MTEVNERLKRDEKEPGDTEARETEARQTVAAGGAAATIAEQGAPDSKAHQPTIGEAAASVATSYGGKRAYLQLVPQYRAIPADRVIRITLDVTYCVTHTFGVLAEVEKLKDDLERECPTLPKDLPHQLRQAAYGLAYAETMKRGAADAPEEDRDDPVAAVRAIRDHLAGDVVPLIKRGRVSGESVKLSQGNSPRNVAFDVLKLVSAIDGNLEYLDGRSLTTRADLEAAAAAAENLLEYLGTKEQSTENAEEVSLMRQRAMTLFVELFEELRWGVRFTRRKQKDANLIMPSLYTLRAKRKSAAEEDDDVDAEDLSASDGGGAAVSSEVDLAQLDSIMSGGASAAPARSTSGEASRNTGIGNPPNG